MNEQRIHRTVVVRSRSRRVVNRVHTWPTVGRRPEFRPAGCADPRRQAHGSADTTDATRSIGLISAATRSYRSTRDVACPSILVHCPRNRDFRPIETSLSPTRVLHVIESDGLYGAERVVLALARQAGADSDLPASIACLVADPSSPHPVQQAAGALGVPCHLVPLRSRFAVFDLPRLIGTIKQLGAGLLHTHGYKATVAGYVARVGLGVPMMATCHLWFEEGDAKWTYRLLSSVERRVYPRLPMVVAVSDALADVLARRGVNRDRIRVIYNGIEPPPVAASNDSRQIIRERFGVSPTTFLVITVGRLAEQKAQADLIAAIALLRGKGEPVAAIILGDGHLRPQLARQIEETSLSGVVHLAGFQPNVTDHLRAADAFALTSLDEGLPIALLDAIAAGIPTISTPVGAVPIVISNDVNGLLVPVNRPEATAEAIRRLMREPELRARLTANARRTFAERFTAEAMYRQYRDVYCEVVHGHDPATVRRR